MLFRSVQLYQERGAGQHPARRYLRQGTGAKDYADLMLNSAVSIEIHDSQSDKLIAKYGDKSSIDKVNAILDIENWEKVENIDKNINPIYTLELYYDTTKQDANDDIKEITIYSNGEYVSFFTTSPGGVKQNYKTNIDIAELIDK